MNLLNYLYEKYKEVDANERSAFWIIFIFSNILYSYQAYNSLIGAHSFYLLNDSVQNLTWAGRFSSHWFSYLSYSVELPLLSNALCMLPLAIGAIYMARLWLVPKKILPIVLLGSFLVATPHSISWLYYTVIGNYWPFFFLPAALFLLQTKCNYRFALATILIAVSFGIYQISINTLAVIFLGMIIANYLQDKALTKEIIKKYFYISCGCVAGFMCYMFALLGLKLARLAGSTNFTKVENPFEILYKIPLTFMDTLSYFKLNQPYLELDYKITVIIIFVLAFISAIISIFTSFEQKEKLRGILLCCVGAVFLIFCTNLANIIHLHNNLLEPRVAFYGYVPLVLFSMALVIKSTSKIISNVGVLVILLLIFISSANNLWFQKNWKLSTDIELSRVERIIDRVEKNENFSYETKYWISFVGDFTDYQHALYTGTSNDIVIYPFSVHLSVYGHTFSHVEPRLETHRSKQWGTKFFTTEQTKQKIIEALKTAKAWPAKSSVQIIDDVILVVWSDKALQEAKEHFDIK